MEIIWLGQSGFKISSEGKTLLIDPWKDFPPGNKLFPEDIKIDDADVIAITHGHLDHFGETMSIAHKLSKTKILTNFELMMFLMEMGVEQDRLSSVNIGGTAKVEGIGFTMTQAFHSSGIGGFGPKKLLYGGMPAGYVISLADKILYHAGDTGLFSDMKLIGEMYRPEVVMLPIGDVYTMGPKEALKAVEYLRPKKVIPMHYGGTFKLPGDPKKFKELVKKEFGKEVEVVVPSPGKKISI